MTYDLLPPGATIRASGVFYRVWAPQAGRVQVEIFSKEGTMLRTVALAAREGGFFEGEDAQGRAGDRYKFRLDESGSFPDPASRWQPEGVHGPSMVIDPRVYQWKDAGWQRPTFRDLVIYEMHVGAFTPEGTYRSAIEKLPLIRELGVTAIELLPIGDFAGDRNWGYDGVCLFAPTRAYGHPDDLRALVDAAHAVGLAVILDVVYNHFGPDGNYLHAYIGDYLDETAKTPWGGAIRYGHPEFKPLRDWVISNPGYWMRDFRVDGFRLDATHAIFDQSSRHMLQECTASIHARGGFAIAEDPRNDVRLVLPEAEGGYGFDAVWADDFHHSVRVANTGESEGYFADFTGTPGEVVEALRHGWFYRGQYSVSEKGPRGTDATEAPPQCFVHCISNHDQTGNHAFGERLSHRVHPAALRAADVLLCLNPSTPMLFMGQEWTASSPFLFFTDHNEELGKLIVAGRKEEFSHFAAFNDPALIDRLPNPQAAATFAKSKLNWEERRHNPHQGSLELYRTCLTLRTAEPAFRPMGRDSWSVEEVSEGIGVLRMNSETADWLVVFDLLGGHSGNLRDSAMAQPGGGRWELVLSSNETRFGGTGSCAVQVERMELDFNAPETVVLRAALG